MTKYLTRKITTVIILALICLLSLCACKKEEARTFDPEDFLYQDGVAWVQLTKPGLLGKKNLDILCIDENGREIFSISDAVHVSNFYNNIALINSRYIINKEGEIIHDLENELGVKIKNFNCRYFDGYIFVEKEQNGVKMTGILDCELNWVIEPTTKLNDIEARGKNLYYNLENGYYDAVHNEFIVEDEYNIRKFQRSFSEDGCIFLRMDSSNEFIYYDSYASWKRATSNTSKYSSSYKIDDFTSSDYKEIARGKIMLDNITKTGFYNQDLELALDLSIYKNVIPLSDLKGGKCLIQFEPKEDKRVHSVGLIDLNGKFLFIHSGYKNHSAEKIEFEDCYFDWNGNYFAKESQED